MPFAIILIGILLISSGARNRAAQLGGLLAGDFSGSDNFFYWVGAVGAVGAVGYYGPLRAVSRLFLFLLLLSMMLSNQGFFAQLISAIQNFQAPAPATVADTGQATADPGAPVTGGTTTDSTAPSTLADLTAKYGDISKAPANTPIPSDLSVPPAAAAAGIATIGDLGKWYNALPMTATTGPSQANPNVATGQPNTPANNFLTGNLGTLGPDLYQGMSDFFGGF